MPDSPPRLRSDIEVIPTVFQGERAFLVRDSLGLIGEPVLLRGAGLQFARLLDGSRNERDLQIEIIRANRNSFVGLDIIRGWLEELDRAFLLESRRYREARARLAADFSREKVRAPYLAGKSYPVSRDKLSAFLSGVLGEEKGPAHDPRPVRALAAPHIDLNVGRETYARAYRSLDPERPPRRILILGTGHSLGEGLMAVSDKAFDTPLGRSAADRDWVKEIRGRGDRALAADDFSHRGEHSIEFQILFLQQVFRSEFQIIPVLCGSFQKWLSAYRRPAEVPGLSGLLSALTDCARQPDTLVVAGVDLSHVGLKFGHSRPAADLMEAMEDHDGKLLAALAKGDVEPFWGEVSRERDHFNVCGFSALACLLEILPDVEGRILDYRVWQETATQSAVSFSAVGFYTKKA